MSLPQKYTSRGEEIVAYECASHPSNMQTCPLIDLWLIHPNNLHWLMVLRTNSNVKSTKNKNL